MPLQAVESRRLYRQIADQIAALIERGEYGVGQRLPPERKGTPMRRASWAAPKVTIAGSGLPNVGAPDCMDMEAAKVPNTTGAPD